MTNDLQPQGHPTRAPASQRGRTAEVLKHAKTLGKKIEVMIDASAAIDLFLRRMSRDGWRPDRLKIQVMLEPRRETKNLQVLEDVLEVGAEAKK